MYSYSQNNGTGRESFGAVPLAVDVSDVPVCQASEEHANQRRSPEVDSFYHLGSDSLSGLACNGTACFVARHLNPSLWKKAEVQSTRVYCMGQCFCGPASFASEDRLVSEGRPRIGASAGSTVILERLLKGGAPSLLAYRAFGGYRALEMALSMNPRDVVTGVEASELRGRGGAGFPTGVKWRSVSEQISVEKYVVANADEGDPGAYIDRYLMEDDPHALIEGMLLAAYAVGATKGWIYLRREYPRAKVVLEQALAEARNAQILGRDCLGTGRSFDIEIHVGKGSYVCGEETALFRSLEGLRPEVMARPPYPSVHGLFGKPTVINNVETLVTIPWIVQHGAAAYRQLGFSKSRGTKVISLNSLFRHPGLYEVEFGVSLRHIVEELGGGMIENSNLKGMIIGGPFAGMIPPQLFATAFAFEELREIGASVGHGGVIAFDDQTSVLELLHHAFSFAAFESCGKCTPCRLGSRRIESVLADLLAEPQSTLWKHGACDSILSALRDASLCGLGRGVAELTDSALRYYGKELGICPH